MKIFLAGTFKTKSDGQNLEKIFNLLVKDGYDVWWASKKVKRGYSSRDLNLLKQIVKTEEDAINDSDILVAVMKRASFGTAMEIKHAHDFGKPVIAYLLSGHPDFESGSFNYRVNNIVKNLDDLLEAIRQYE
jgi:nucleoside 2-deoxyribosyltransferase